MKAIKRFILNKLADFGLWLIELGPREGFGEKTPQDYEIQRQLDQLKKEANE